MKVLGWQLATAHTTCCEMETSDLLLCPFVEDQLCIEVQLAYFYTRFARAVLLLRVGWLAS